MSKKKQIVHIITGLDVGGAEMMLYKLLAEMKNSDYRVAVISLKDKGEIGERISALGIPVYCINMQARKLNIIGCWRLIRLFRQLKPALIQSWMYHANIMSTFARFFAARKAVLIWNIRNSLPDLSYLSKDKYRLLIRLGRHFSFLPDKIIYNAMTSAKQHEKLGYLASKTQIIPNGFLCDTFSPSLENRQVIRSEWGIDDDAILIGVVARYHEIKDHHNFIQAAAKIRQSYSGKVKFLLTGNQIDKSNKVLYDEIVANDLVQHMCLLGERDDIPHVMAALDILVSSSWQEGFSNSIGEAMACGVPCVVTDVGDSAYIVAETGVAVPPKQPDALAQACLEIIAQPKQQRETLGTQARNRILEFFTIQKIAEQYRSLYKDLITNY